MKTDFDSSSTSSSFSLNKITKDIVYQPGFSYHSNFQNLDFKEQEQLFLTAFENQLLIIRNKELKVLDTPINNLPNEEKLQEIIELRNKSEEKIKIKNSRKLLNLSINNGNLDKPPRIFTNQIPTFDKLLNINFISSFNLLKQFKIIISQKLIKNRIKNRCQKILTSLKSQQLKNINNLNENELNFESLKQKILSIKFDFNDILPKFNKNISYNPLKIDEIFIENFKPEKNYNLYKSNFVEKYQLLPFLRTETNV